MSKHLIATGRYAQGRWLIRTEGNMPIVECDSMKYVVQVERAAGWRTVGEYISRYAAMSRYNDMTATPKRVLAIGPTGGEILRTSDDDGAAAEYAAHNQREIAE